MNIPSSQSLLTCVYECEADLTGFVDHKGNLNMYDFVFIHKLWKLFFVRSKKTSHQGQFFCKRKSPKRSCRGLWNFMGLFVQDCWWLCFRLQLHMFVNVFVRRVYMISFHVMRLCFGLGPRAILVQRLCMLVVNVVLWNCESYYCTGALYDWLWLGLRLRSAISSSFDFNLLITHPVHVCLTLEHDVRCNVGSVQTGKNAQT